MMHVVIDRTYEKSQTRGVFRILDDEEEVIRVKCLELPFLNNQHNISCILEGEYDCEKIYHEKFGMCFLVKNVPGRDGIIIHVGNFAAGNKVDTRGCIIPGLLFVDINNDGNLDVKHSTVAMNVLRVLLPYTFKLKIQQAA